MLPRLSDIDLVQLAASSPRDRGRRAFLLKSRRLAAAGVAAMLIPNFGAAQGQTAASPTRVRGVIQSASQDEIVVKIRSGEEVRIALAPGLMVNEVYPIELSQIHANSFIGVASRPQGDGSLRAVGVTLFPEAMRGTGEGHRPFDLAPQSTMTNATVSETTGVTGEPEGRRLRVRYPGGEQTILVPPGTPIVSFRPGDRSLLVPGASVSLVARTLEGKMTAERVNAGRVGFSLPY